MNKAERAELLLKAGPLSRHELEYRLGLSQQRVSEILRQIGAKVVAYQPRATRGHPHPIYGLESMDTGNDFTQLARFW